MGIIRFLFTLIIVLALGIFSVFNTENISILYSPLHDPVSVPVYALGFIFLIIGFIWGAFNVWVNDGKIRRERKDLRKQLAYINKEIDKAQEAERQASRQQRSRDAAVNDDGEQIFETTSHKL